MQAKPKKTVSAATLRQRKRREKLKKAGGKSVVAVLNKTQGRKLDSLVDVGYAENQSAVLAKGVEEAYDREVKTKRQK